jgi:hypothetical protein
MAPLLDEPPELDVAPSLVATDPSLPLCGLPPEPDDCIPLLLLLPPLLVPPPSPPLSLLLLPHPATIATMTPTRAKRAHPLPLMGAA